MNKFGSPQYMQVPEVARYLGINEKKVYLLAKAGKIPCTRVTGKWTFPKTLIDRWIEDSAGGMVGRRRGTEDRSFVLCAGSDDPSLGILGELYMAQIRPASFFTATVGSSAGLHALREGSADLATAHLFDPARSFATTGAERAPAPVVVELFYRELGLVVRRGNPKRIEAIRDLGRAGVRFVNRQAGSGTRLYLDHELARARIKSAKIAGYGTQVTTHLEVGVRVLRGEADAGLATRTAAQMLGLEFVPLARERFDMLVRRDSFFSESVQTMLGIVGSARFRERVGALGGYDVAGSGRIVTPLQKGR